MPKRQTKKPDWISWEDWDAADIPEITAKQFAEMRPASEVVPDIVARYRRRLRGKQKAPAKVLISLRVGRDVLDHFRASGKGWQTRMESALREHIAGK
jgi:uncharacterized protein (DUF4415 family)